ncbi:hypothetical protein [Methyloglobulus sp.]
MTTHAWHCLGNPCGCPGNSRAYPGNLLWLSGQAQGLPLRSAGTSKLTDF